MKESDFVDILDKLKSDIYPVIMETLYQNGQTYYNKLMQEGFDMDEALYNLIHTTAYESIKMSVAISLAMVYGIEQDGESDLKAVLKRIK